MGREESDEPFLFITFSFVYAFTNKGDLRPQITTNNEYFDPRANESTNVSNTRAHINKKSPGGIQRLFLFLYKNIDIHLAIPVCTASLKDRYTIVMITHNMQQAAGLHKYTLSVRSAECDRSRGASWII